ncbi:hypothetical protein BLNAU_10503 [Blattamonas nauphoetae]|uniref:Uncharacterized protein n=1 Tax=Blattamonas nauphoetae TaxID=2049346 RepID=A0ABQ9XS60_9EUKA|nr:hypothetical protein BLNAU_10503 [Blattamonas nauphoetae]
MTTSNSNNNSTIKLSLTYIPGGFIKHISKPKPTISPPPRTGRTPGPDLSTMTKEECSKYLMEEAKKEELICPITRLLLVDPVRARLVLNVDPSDNSPPPIATVSRAYCEDPQAVTDHQASDLIPVIPALTSIDPSFTYFDGTTQMPADHKAVERLEEFTIKFASFLDDWTPRVELGDDLFD